MVAATVASRTNHRPHFGDKLALELERQQVSRHDLARRLNPGEPENARRLIRKWIKGQHSPVRSSRVLVAEALGLESGHFDDEDEEEDAEMLDLLVALVSQIERRVVAAADRRLKDVA